MVETKKNGQIEKMMSTISHVFRRTFCSLHNSNLYNHYCMSLPFLLSLYVANRFVAHVFYVVPIWKVILEQRRLSMNIFPSSQSVSVSLQIRLPLSISLLHYHSRNESTSFSEQNVVWDELRCAYLVVVLCLWRIAELFVFLLHRVPSQKVYHISRCVPYLSVLRVNK